MNGAEVVDLLTDLVAIDSVNPDLSPGGAGEAEIARYVRDWAQMQGLRVELVDEPAGRPSVVVRGGSTAEGCGRLLLCAHLDTVGVGGMTDPTTPRIEGDRLYGRGAYDMKAGLAASLIACREADRNGFPGEVVVAAVADEENASVGVQSVLPLLAADAAIVTEPTELVVGIAHRGFVWTEIEVTGVAAHGSRPHLGVDAIVKTGPVLVALDELGRTLGRRENALLGPGVVHAGLIRGGQEVSTIPERCVLTVERRTLPGETVADVEAEVEHLLDACRAADPALVAESRTLLHRPPLETDPDEPIVGTLCRAVESVRRRPAEVGGMSYWADSAFLAAHGIPDRPVRAGRRGRARGRRVGQPHRHRRLRPHPHRHRDDPVHTRSESGRYGQRRGTVGNLAFSPAQTNVMPAQAVLTVDLRNFDDGLMTAAEKHLPEFVDDLQRRHGVAATWEADGQDDAVLANAVLALAGPVAPSDRPAAECAYTPQRPRRRSRWPGSIVHSVGALRPLPAAAVLTEAGDAPAPLPIHVNSGDSPMTTSKRAEVTKPSTSPGERLVAKLPERIQRQPLSRIVVGVVAAVASIGLLIVLLTSVDSNDTEVKTAAPEPAAPVAAPAIAAPLSAAAAVDTDVAPAPGMDPDLAPPDGPGPDSPPFGVDALAMRDELRTHGVDLSDDKLYILVDTANKYIAEGDMDLDAWDPRIMADVKTLWPDLAKGEVIDVTRCTAEYIERVLARNAGLPHPPDEDDHNQTVDGRGPQARLGGH